MRFREKLTCLESKEETAGKKKYDALGFCRLTNLVEFASLVSELVPREGTEKLCSAIFVFTTSPPSIILIFFPYSCILSSFCSATIALQSICFLSGVFASGYVNKNNRNKARKLKEEKE